MTIVGTSVSRSRSVPVESLPWSPSDLTRLLWTTVIAAGGVMAGYLGVSSTVVLSRQLAWLSVSIAMVAVAGLGNAVFLTNGARAVRLRTRRLVMFIERINDDDDPA